MERRKPPNWFRVHIETQNGEVRRLSDAIASRIQGSTWASQDLRQAAQLLQRAAEAYTEALYRELPFDQQLVQDRRRVTQDYEGYDVR